MLADWESVTTFVPEDLAEGLVRSNPEILCDRTPVYTGLKSFRKDGVESTCILYSRMESAEWIVDNGRDHVSPRGFWANLGDDYFDAFGLWLKQHAKMVGETATIESSNT